MKPTFNLLEQLKEFGLNPRCWSLKKTSQKNQWLIVHKEEKGLCLKGQTVKKSWADLEWVF